MPADDRGEQAGHLGFTYRLLGQGEVRILHHGKHAATLRGKRANDFLSMVASGDPAAQQQLMARLTGNYKRGNERTARRHPRNSP